MGITSLLLVLIVRFIFVSFPMVQESVYFDGLFPFIRRIQSWLYFLWIVPGYYIIAALLLLIIVFGLRRRKPWKNVLMNGLNGLGWIVSVYMVYFGFQYTSQGYAERNHLTIDDYEVNIAAIYLEVMEDAHQARLRLELPADSSILSVSHIPSDEEISSWVSGVLSDFPASTIPTKAQRVRPEGTLRRLGISGIYNPFTGEANIDAGLTNLQQVYVLAHELAHSMGITSEAEANFVSFLACLKSQDPIGEYAAHYMLWRQVAREVNRELAPEQVEALAAQIPEELRQDREAIIRQYYKHEAYFPELTDAFNDTYLKMQGISSGVENYNEFLQLYLSWRNSND